MYTREQEREAIQKTVAAFEKVLGQKPTGYLSPGHASTPGYNDPAYPIEGRVTRTAAPS